MNFDLHPGRSAARLRGSSHLLLIGLSLALLPISGCGMAYIGEEPIPRNNVFQGFSGRLVDGESGDGVANAKITVRPAADTEPRPFYIYSTGDGSFQLSTYKRQGVSTPLELGEEYQLVISSINHRIRDFKVTFEGGEQKLGAVELSRVEEGGKVEMVIPGTLEGQVVAERPAPPRLGPPIP